MNPKLDELMAAFPPDSDAETEANSAAAQLQQIFADLAGRPVPASSLHRLWTIGELSTQIALARLSLWMRGWFANADEQQRQAAETNLRVALKIFHRLGYLRGALAKLGQAAGDFPQVIPAQIADTLDRLHFDAPPMHYSLIRELLENELGVDWEGRFQAFDKQPFAAASIGQVHRAVLKSGEIVAVKIQYPGIARTIDADFRNLSAVLFPMRLGKSWDSVKEQFEAIRQMLQQEIDYEQEAQSVREARAIFANDNGIVVPTVFGAHCTKRVLTMQYLPGRHLPNFLATHPNQDLRNSFGAKLLLTWYRMHAARMNYADPQSGNYLFLDDGRLGLIDFGCVQHFTSQEFEALRLSYLSDDTIPETVRELLRRTCQASDADLANEEYLGLMNDAIRWMKEPIRHPGPFDFGDEEHLRRGLGWFGRLIAKRYTRSDPMFVYFHRSVFGLRSLLYRLGARVDFQTLPIENWWNSIVDRP